MLQTRPRLYLVILKVRAAKRYRYLTTAFFSRFPWKNHQPTKPQELFAVVEIFVFAKYASKNQTFGYTTQIWGWSTLLVEMVSKGLGWILNIHPRETSWGGTLVGLLTRLPPFTWWVGVWHVMESPWINCMDTLPETNSSHLKIGLPNRKVVFQPSIFRGRTVGFREGSYKKVEPDGNFLLQGWEGARNRVNFSPIPPRKIWRLASPTYHRDLCSTQQFHSQETGHDLL